LVAIFDLQLAGKMPSMVQNPTESYPKPGWWSTSGSLNRKIDGETPLKSLAKKSTRIWKKPLSVDIYIYYRLLQYITIVTRGPISQHPTFKQVLKYHAYRHNLWPGDIETTDRIAGDQAAKFEVGEAPKWW
jgi:hypothetical protein